MFLIPGDPAADWWETELADPIFSGENQTRCGPNFDSAGCPVDPRIGRPCCSPVYYCGITEENGINFYEIFQIKNSKLWISYKRLTVDQELISAKLFPARPGRSGVTVIYLNTFLPLCFLTLKVICSAGIPRLSNG